MFLFTGKKSNFVRIFSAAALVMAVAPVQAADYVVDAAHSKAGFSVKHMMISTVEGKFNEFEGVFTFDPKKSELTNAKFEAKAASIDTGNAKRDEHLRAADFFDTAKFPTISITNSKIKAAGKDKYTWTGDLNMHGVTKPVTLNVVYKGSIKDMQGQMRAGFEATGKISRKEWGLTWNKALESGGAVVSDEVMLDFDVEAVEQAAKK